MDASFLEVSQGWIGVSAHRRHLFRLKGLEMTEVEVEVVRGGDSAAVDRLALEFMQATPRGALRFDLAASIPTTTKTKGCFEDSNDGRAGEYDAEVSSNLQCLIAKLATRERSSNTEHVSTLTFG
ncbi:hypothetical protein LTR22_023945 [Elasticomyces elasticus]|nr:hypothetical protein LTR22_023945 [Elasticomyces elasticus]KAK4921146.1 hypothetical protein LTR49_011333 [Elasticomyces elasticus]KAK5761862.1 hypothetical protein LTS12_007925 [Elasticomyces elasticus]